MKRSENTGQRVLLFSLVALIIPMIAFPTNFGMQLAKGSLIHALFELVYYGFITFAVYRRNVLLELVQFAGICLVYRLALGALFGILISAMYSMGLMVSITLGMSSYLPAILLQIGLAPFILRPVAKKFFDEPRVIPEIPGAATLAAAPDQGLTSIAVSKERGVYRQTPSPALRHEPEAYADTRQRETGDGLTRSGAGDQSGFERAVRYIGEDGSVQMAVVVDSEGLLVANFCRGDVDPDTWGPLALLLVESNLQVLARGNLGDPVKIDMLLQERRVVVALASDYYLMAVSERHQDDMLPIRVNQAQDIINKYVSERYGVTPNPNAEKIHVSGT